MDVWAWVDKLTDELDEAGEERVASLFYRISEHVADEDIAQAEAILPEALAAARAMENPWAEVFFRHWEMRLRLGLKGEGETALPAMVDLLDFAHSKECEGCPQTVCTTQDIADCYGNIDGPGWAEERRAVVLESLDKITPEWNCHGCLSHQYMEALIDEKRCQEALEYCDAYAAGALKAGHELDATDWYGRADILHGLGRDEEALAMLDKARECPDWQDDARRRYAESLVRVEVLAALGRLEEAWELLPSWGDTVPGSYDDWLRAAATIAGAVPEHNTWELGSCFQQGMEQCSRVGAHRKVMDIGKNAVELAILRGAYATPRRALGLMRRHLPKLRAPLGADAMLDDLERRVAALTPPLLPVPAAELAEYINAPEQPGAPNAEQELDWLYAAMEERPDDMELLSAACSALDAMRATDEARGLLWAFIRRNPAGCAGAVNAFIRCTPPELGEELTALAEFLEPQLPDSAHWLRLYRAYRDGDFNEVAVQAKRYLAERPDSINGRRVWADSAMEAKEFAEATRLRLEIADLAAKAEDEFLNDHRWDLLAAATCAGEHALVRDTCIAMGFDIEAGDTPIDEPGQYVRIRYQEEGRTHTAIARRSGPVTARIVSGFWPRQIQRTEDLVVFDPELLEPYPEDEEEKKGFYPPYSLVHTLSKGSCKSWLVDGFFPGREAFRRLSAALEERGWYVDVRCDADYTIADPDADPGAISADAGEGDDAPFPPPGRLDGICFLLTAPSSVPLTELDALLSRETKDWPHPLCWFELAKAAGKNPEKHAALIERYGLG